MVAKPQVNTLIIKDKLKFTRQRFTHLTNSHTGSQWRNLEDTPSVYWVSVALKANGKKPAININNPK